MNRVPQNEPPPAMNRRRFCFSLYFTNKYIENVFIGYQYYAAALLLCPAGAVSAALLHQAVMTAAMTAARMWLARKVSHIPLRPIALLRRQAAGTRITR